MHSRRQFILEGAKLVAAGLDSIPGGGAACKLSRELAIRNVRTTAATNVFFISGPILSFEVRRIVFTINPNQ